MTWKYWDSEHWINRSREMRQKYPKCYCCGSNATCTHHRHYNSTGAEKDEDLITLCHPCHNSVETGIDRELWDRMDGHKHWREAIRTGKKGIIALAASADYKARKRKSRNRKKKDRCDRHHFARYKSAMQCLTRALKRGDHEAARYFLSAVSELLDEAEK